MTVFNNRLLKINKEIELVNTFSKANIYKLLYEEKNISEDPKQNIIDNSTPIISNDLDLFIIRDYLREDNFYNHSIANKLDDINFQREAFSHFSLQYTKGYLIYYNFKIECNILYDPSISMFSIISNFVMII